MPPSKSVQPAEIIGLPSVTHHMSKLPFVSIICWDAGFREHADAVFSALRQDYPSDRIEVIWVDYHDTLHPDVHRISDPRLRSMVLGMSRDKQYSVGTCINRALSVSRGEIIFVLDGDVVFPDSLVRTGVEEHRNRNDLALYFYRLDEPGGAAPVERTLEGLREVCRLEYPENYGGGLSVRRENILAVNGYEEHELFSGTGAVSRDLAMRFKAKGFAIKWHPEAFLFHGWHPGTVSTPNPAQRFQHEVISQRSKSLIASPAVGLDPSFPVRDRTLEQVLIAFAHELPKTIRNQVMARELLAKGALGGSMTLRRVLRGIIRKMN